IVTVASLMESTEETSTRSIVGELPSVVERVARYWRYLAFGLLIVEPVTAVKADHETSGVSTLPVRVSKTMFVLVGTLTVALKICHVPESPKNTRDKNVHGLVYGPMRIQSTMSVLPDRKSTRLNSSHR